MNFGFSEEQEMLRATIGKFMKNECSVQYVRECDEGQKVPFEVFHKIADQGWLGLAVPEEYGGSGGTIIDLAILLEETAKVSLALADLIYRARVHGGMNILKCGTEEQKKELLPGIAGGKLIFCIGLTEPNTGSDAASLTTSAVADGEDYIIVGTKMFTTNMHVADYCLLYVRTDKTAPKHKGITTFLVDTKSPGIKIRPVHTLGMRATITNEVVYENVRVPKRNILGKLNEGWTVATSQLGAERFGLAAMCTGAAQSVLDDALQYAKERVQFGRPIGKFQAISHKLADMQVEVDVSRLLTYRLAWMVTQGTSDLKTAAITKLYTAEAYKHVSDLGMQILGGYGYTMEFDMQRHFRDSRLVTIGGGSSEIQRNIIAKSLGL
ncbi:MAG: acyl-CoA dehydrogenase family protein [Thermodesulfobacteriota bacterium]|nr:acyl-CoA dehydrogenase family protein [Thermodesulfobacteriota bacterium]